MKGTGKTSKALLRFFVLQFIFIFLLHGTVFPFSTTVFAETVRPAKVAIPISLEMEGEDNPEESFYFVIDGSHLSF